MHWKIIDQVCAATGKSRNGVRKCITRFGAPETLEGFLAWNEANNTEQKRRRKERAKKWSKSANRLAYLKKYRESGRDSERQRKYAAAHPEKFAPGSKLYENKKRRYSSRDRMDEINERERLFRLRDPQKARAQSRAVYNKQRQRPEVVVSTRLRNRLVYALRQAGKKAPKAAGVLSLVGCSIQDLMRHIESQFAPGMAWNNRELWHIDHIRPVDSFDMFNIDEQRACFHYTNLQPLWALENLKKSDTFSDSSKSSLANTKRFAIGN